MNTVSEATYQGIKNAGFNSDNGFWNIKNDLHVSLIDFLTEIGFKKQFITEKGKKWIVLKKKGIDFHFTMNAHDPKVATISNN